MPKIFRQGRGVSNVSGFVIEGGEGGETFLILMRGGAKNCSRQEDGGGGSKMLPILGILSILPNFFPPPRLTDN